MERIAASPDELDIGAVGIRHFYLNARCAREPPLTGDARLDALAGAVPSISRQYRLPTVPAWASRARLGILGMAVLDPL